MNRYSILLILALAFAGCGRRSTPPQVQLPPGAVQVEFPASDGQADYADLYKGAKGRADRVVLMFHQAGSNAGEYSAIAPQLAGIGYDCLAVDQRSGGVMFGRPNRTAAVCSGGTGYLDAYADLKGALAWANGQGYKQIVAWGSSYSASLVLKLAGESHQIAKALAFSPGEYMDDKGVVKKWAASVKVPVFFVCTRDEANDRLALFNALGSARSSQVCCLPGTIHGSSTMIPGKCPSAAEYMTRVEAFLRR